MRFTMNDKKFQDPTSNIFIRHKPTVSNWIRCGTGLYIKLTLEKQTIRTKAIQ
jgi:hypothetical protein